MARNPQYDSCKGLHQHAWDPDPLAPIRKALMYPDSIGALHLRCMRCTTERETEYDEYGRWTSHHHYVRPVDYKDNGEVKLSTASMRLLWLGKRLPKDAT